MLPIRDDDDDDKRLKIELLSQWMIEAEFCNYSFGKSRSDEIIMSHK